MKVCLPFVLLLGGLATSSLAFSPETDPTLPETAALERRLRNRAEFVARLDQWIADLETNTRPLCEVVRSLHAFAEEFHTDYLTQVHAGEKGRDHEESLALNLIRHFESSRSYATDRARLETTIRRLRSDLAAWKPERSGQP